MDTAFYGLEDVDRFAIVGDYAVIFMMDECIILAEITDETVIVASYFDPNNFDPEVPRDQALIAWLMGVYMFLAEPIDANVCTQDHSDRASVFLRLFNLDGV